MFAQIKGRITHDPAAPRCRSPLGAVAAGTPVTLRLLARTPLVAAADLLLFGADGATKCIPMQKEEGAFAVTVETPTTPGVLWYYFVLKGEGMEPCCYGAGTDGESCFGTLYRDHPPAFQLTVHAAGFATPGWLRHSVMYQIFPDRFAKGEEDAIAAGLAHHAALGRKLWYRPNWQAQPCHQPLEGEAHYRPLDIYGGTLRALQQKLPYLKELGISVIYLNPIFEADSNHRYNTADYKAIDPILGSEEDFRALSAAATAHGIRLLLDGVFSHTGDDSRYFDRYARYGSGAYGNEDSPYRSWYHIEADGTCRCWWGFESLPEVDEHDPAWQQFIIQDENSVMRHWLRQGAAGYRLDVADELPDDVLELMRSAVKEEDPDAVLLGEVWEDATTKESYGQKRRYALGHALDSVMNYPLAEALISYALGKTGAQALAAFCLQQRLNYPLPFYYSLMNLLGSHDSARIRTRLATGLDGRGLSREQQAAFAVSAAQNAHGRTLQQLLTAIQYVLPGVPALYYGDEQGMQGFCDPFNRAAFAEQEGELHGWYAALAAARNAHAALQTGAVGFYAPQKDVFGCLRLLAGGKDAFGDAGENGCFLLLVNRGKQPVHTVADLFAPGRGLTEAELAALREAGLHSSRLLLATQEEAALPLALQEGLAEVTLPPLCAALWQLV